MTSDIGLEADPSRIHLLNWEYVEEDELVMLERENEERERIEREERDDGLTYEERLKEDRDDQEAEYEQEYSDIEDDLSTIDGGGEKENTKGDKDDEDLDVSWRPTHGPPGRPSDPYCGHRPPHQLQKPLAKRFNIAMGHLSATFNNKDVKKKSMMACKVHFGPLIRKTPKEKQNTIVTVEMIRDFLNEEMTNHRLRFDSNYWTRDFVIKRSEEKFRNNCNIAEARDQRVEARKQRAAQNLHNVKSALNGNNGERTNTNNHPTEENKFCAAVGAFNCGLRQAQLHFFSDTATDKAIERQGRIGEFRLLTETLRLIMVRLAQSNSVGYVQIGGTRITFPDAIVTSVEPSATFIALYQGRAIALTFHNVQSVLQAVENRISHVPGHEPISRKRSCVESEQEDTRIDEMEETDTIQLYVKALDKTIVVSILRGATISELKQQIESVTMIPARLMNLTCKGKPLIDHFSLQGSFIFGGDTVILTMRLLGGMILPCTTVDCKKPIHYHKKKKTAAQGAERRKMEQTKFEPKPTKIEDLVVCNEKECFNPNHFHISASDRKSHGKFLTSVSQSLTDSTDQEAGYNDAEEEKENFSDSHGNTILPSQGGAVLPKWSISKHKIPAVLCKDTFDSHQNKILLSEYKKAKNALVKIRKMGPEYQKICQVPLILPDFRAWYDLSHTTLQKEEVYKIYFFLIDIVQYETTQRLLKEGGLEPRPLGSGFLKTQAPQTIEEAMDDTTEPSAPPEEDEIAKTPDTPPTPAEIRNRYLFSLRKRLVENYPDYVNKAMVVFETLSNHEIVELEDNYTSLNTTMKTIIAFKPPNNNSVDSVDDENSGTGSVDNSVDIDELYTSVIDILLDELISHEIPLLKEESKNELLLSGYRPTGAQICTDIVLYQGTRPIVDDTIIYTVGGYDPYTMLVNPDGVPVSQHGDLRLEEFELAQREFRWFKRLRQIPEWIKDWFVGFSLEDPFYYGKTLRLQHPISLKVLNTLSRTRLGSRVSEAIVRSVIYQAQQDPEVAQPICFATALYFIKTWTLLCAQTSSVISTNEAFLKAKKVPMNVPTALDVQHGIEQAREFRIPAGIYHHDTELPIHLPHSSSGDFGDIDHPSMVQNKRWRLLKTKGGAKYSKGYIKFPSHWFTEAYSSIYYNFVSMVATVKLSSEEIEKILLRLTMDKTGRDEFMITQQQKAFNCKEIRDWLFSMGDTNVYPTEEGWALEFLRPLWQAYQHPYNDEDFFDAATAYTIKTGIKVNHRLRIIEQRKEEIYYNPTSHLEVLFKKFEKQKVKPVMVEGIVRYMTTYARAFISLPDNEWLDSAPHLCSKFKQQLSQELVWTKVGMLCDDGFVNVANPGRDWMHINCLYPTINDEIQVDKQHLADCVQRCIEFMEITGGIATMAHGDDAWEVEKDGNEPLFVEADIVSNDISHTQFSLAATAISTMFAGTYCEKVWKQMQRPIKIRNGHFRGEWVSLINLLGFTFPTGSGITTGHNTHNNTVICYADAKFGYAKAADQIGYTREVKVTRFLEQSTFLAHWFYYHEGKIVATICPSVLCRGGGGTPGDFLGPRTLSVKQRGFNHITSVVKGLAHELPTPIIEAFRSLIPGHIPRGVTEALDESYILGLIRRTGVMVDPDEVLNLCDQIREIRYGTLIVNPIVDALLKVRYGVPPTAV